MIGTVPIVFYSSEPFDPCLIQTINFKIRVIQVRSNFNANRTSLFRYQTEFDSRPIKLPPFLLYQAKRRRDPLDPISIAISLFLL